MSEDEKNRRMRHWMYSVRMEPFVAWPKDEKEDFYVYPFLDDAAYQRFRAKLMAANQD